MTQTLTTERLKQITDAISAEPHDYESIYDSIKHGEIAAMARELLANREAQPVGFTSDSFMYELKDSGVVHAWLRRDADDPGFSVKLYTAPPAPAVPTPVNFSENSDADMCRAWAWERVKELVSTDGWTLGDNITYFGFFCWGWDMRRQYNEQRPPVVNSQLTGAPAVPDEATAENVEALSGYVSTYKMTENERDIAAEVWNACRAAMLAQPVSQGCKLPENVREALALALQAMEFMGDTLNNIDAVCTEDVEYVTPAFTAVRKLLAAAPEGGNG